jgi:hypothetical protein
MEISPSSDSKWHIFQSTGAHLLNGWSWSLQVLGLKALWEIRIRGYQLHYRHIFCDCEDTFWSILGQLGCFLRAWLVVREQNLAWLEVTLLPRVSISSLDLRIEISTLWNKERNCKPQFRSLSLLDNVLGPTKQNTVGLISTRMAQWDW